MQGTPLAPAQAAGEAAIAEKPSAAPTWTWPASRRAGLDSAPRVVGPSGAGGDRVIAWLDLITIDGACPRLPLMAILIRMRRTAGCPRASSDQTPTERHTHEVSRLALGREPRRADPSRQGRLDHESKARLMERMMLGSAGCWCAG